MVVVATRKTDSATTQYTQTNEENVYLEANPAQAEELYQEWFQTQKQKEVGYYNPCSCVSYAKWKSGIDVGSIKLAKNHPIDSQSPIVGAIVVFNLSPAGHLAVVTEVFTDTIVIAEANYSPCRVGTREVSRDDPTILGYYY